MFKPPPRDSVGRLTCSTVWNEREKGTNKGQKVAEFCDVATYTL